MKKIWNEYGLIAILLVVSVGGYLSLGDQKEDFLSDPLDAIGARFAQLMADDASRAEFSETYAEFKKKVHDHEISPDQVESIAASVLNLESSGAELSPADAEMVIAMATESAQTVLPLPFPGLVASGPSDESDIEIGVASADVALSYNQDGSYGTVDVSPERYREMSERMADVFALADEMDVIAREQSGASEIRSHVRFTVNDGIAVVVDSSAARAWTTKNLRPITRDLERKRMVIYQHDVKDDRGKRAEAFSRRRQEFERARSMQSVASEEEVFLYSLERLSKLREMGMVVHLDTVMLRMQIEQSLRLIMDELDEMESQDNR